MCFSPGPSAGSGVGPGGGNSAGASLLQLSFERNFSTPTLFIDFDLRDSAGGGTEPPVAPPPPPPPAAGEQAPAAGGQRSTAADSCGGLAELEQVRPGCSYTR